MRRIASSLAALALLPILSTQALGQQAELRPPEDAATAAVRGLAKDLANFYKTGFRDGADRFVAAHPEIVFFDQADSPVRVTARYVEKGAVPQRIELQGGQTVYFAFGSGSQLEVTAARKPGADDRPLVVAVPPGTYGTSSSSDEQDLGLLRAPVMVLGKGQRAVTVDVPIACASFEKEGPEHGHGFTLRRFERGSDIDRLMVALCAGDDAPEAAAQLSVWVVRNGISRQTLAEHMGVVTFGRHLPVHIGEGPAAERLIRAAGLDPRRMHFFGGRDERRASPQEAPGQPPAAEVPELPVDPASNVS